MPSRPAPDTARRFWNTAADTWHHTEAELDDSDDDRTVELLSLAPGARVLDAGCGTGRRAAALGTAGFEVVALDLADAMVACAKPTIGGRLVQGEVRHLPYRAGAFDAALCAYVLDFIADPVPVLRDLHRVVRPEGRLLLVSAGAVRGPRQESWRRFLHGLHHPAGPLPWEVPPLLAHTGWDLVYEEGLFGHGRNHTPNPVTNLTAVDPTTWKQGLQALADGWRFLAVAQPRKT